MSLSTVGGYLIVQITKQTQYHQYRIGIRTSTNDWDSVYTMTGTLVDTIKGLSSGTHFVSAMSVDTNGIESLPSTEYSKSIVGINELPGMEGKLELLQNKPNPFDDATYITVNVKEVVAYKEAYISVKNVIGEEIKRLPIKLNDGINEVLYRHPGIFGTYIYTLVIDGKPVETKTMVFAN